MPCSDRGRDDPPVRYRDNPEVKERLDRATRLLCSLLEPMSTEEVTQLSDEMQVWWAKHQVEDRRRKELEVEQKERKRVAALARKTRIRVDAKAKAEKTKQIKAGLAKLTSTEIKALGL